MLDWKYELAQSRAIFFALKHIIMKGLILGKKSLSGQLFTETGERVPVTRIQADSCYLVGLRDFEKNGYKSVIVGFGKTKKISKPEQGLLKKAGISDPLHFLREFRTEYELIQKEGKNGVKIGEVEIMIGDQITPQLLFKVNDLVDVTGVSKGKGFAGVVKRHGFKGGPRTHGQSDRERAPGSIGQTTTPGRVYKGKRMAGRMGNETNTVRNLVVMEANETELVVKGLVPGARNSLLRVHSH